MKQELLSIRPFIGAKDFVLSKKFYHDLGFDEVPLASNLSLFKRSELGFYLQDAYVKDWIENTMVCMEVTDASAFYRELDSLNLPISYDYVKLGSVRTESWGKVCFLHDPSGILWQFCQFNA